MNSRISRISRISRDHYFMDIAIMTAKRSTCDRAKVGCIAVKNNTIIGTGYNGSPKGMAHCDDVGHELKDGHCIRTVHAEMNIICNCAKLGISLKDATLYCTHEPCYNCIKHLINAGVKKIYFNKSYDNHVSNAKWQEQIIIERLKQ